MTENSHVQSVENQSGHSYRIFLGNLPKVKTETEIRDEVKKITTGLVRVITYKSLEDPSSHRGFCFLDFDTKLSAVKAKKSLEQHTVFGCRTIVDWADPEPQVDEKVMASVRILFVRQHDGVLTEKELDECFGEYGVVERVKTLKNYAFVHFERREDARLAMAMMDGKVVGGGSSGVRLDVSWAKPPADKRHRERMLRDRERRVQTILARKHTNPTVFPSTTCTMNAPPISVCPNSSAHSSPYSRYDHYEYDFDRQTQCTCTRVEVAPQNCHLLCPCSTANRTLPEFAAATTTDGDRGRNYCCDSGDNSRPQRLPQNLAFTRHDRGDCADTADNINVDHKILTFFRKIANRELSL